MLELTKAGKVSIKKTLTKTFNISKSQKKPAIKLIPSDINKPQIVNDGKEWNVEELKSQMVKANALAIKNKGRDITKSEKRVSKLDKFKKAVVDSAREGVKKNIDKKYDELISSVKKMKSIKMKDKPKILEKVYENKKKYLENLSIIENDLGLISNTNIITDKRHDFNDNYDLETRIEITDNNIKDKIRNINKGGISVIPETTIGVEKMHHTTMWDRLSKGEYKTILKKILKEEKEWNKKELIKEAEERKAREKDYERERKTRKEKFNSQR